MLLEINKKQQVFPNPTSFLSINLYYYMMGKYDIEGEFSRTNKYILSWYIHKLFVSGMFKLAPKRINLLWLEENSWGQGLNWDHSWANSSFWSPLRLCTVTTTISCQIYFSHSRVFLNSSSSYLLYSQQILKK